MIHIVVSRHQEDLAWLHLLPAHCRIRVYNHGQPLDVSALPEGAVVTPVAAGGGHAAGYLRHLQHVQEQMRAPRGNECHADSFTVFTPGNPFAHAPAFLDLLRDAHCWGDVQPLSMQAAAPAQGGHGVPPPSVAERDARDWLGTLPVRPERYSLSTWAPLLYVDEAAWRQAERYRFQHGLENGSNLTAHFHELCGLPRLAEDAADADIGVMAHGGVFAVRQRAIDAFLREAAAQLDRMATLCRADPLYPVLFERSWLHHFGLPYVRLESLPRPAGSFEPAAHSMAKVSAAIDAVLARAESRATSRPTPPAMSAALRQRARSALHDGDFDRATHLMHQAVQLAPDDVDLLADTAALSFQGGDLASAIPMARRALLRQPGHAASQFTLAMALAAQGERREALTHFDALLRGEAAQGFRVEHPELIEIARHQVQTLSPNLPARRAAAPN